MPGLYARWPKCHMPGCNGKMYVDKYRMRKGEKDNAPICTDVFCDYGRQSGNAMPCPHRVSSKGCSGYEKYVSERNSKPRSKHSPIPEDKWVPF